MQWVIALKFTGFLRCESKIVNLRGLSVRKVSSNMLQLELYPFTKTAHRTVFVVWSSDENYHCTAASYNVSSGKMAIGYLLI